MEEPVAADVDNGDGGDGEGLVGRGDFGEEGGDFGGVGAAEDEFVCWAFVNLVLKRLDEELGSCDIPTMRSGPMVRETVLRVVSGGLLEVERVSE